MPDEALINRFLYSSENDWLEFKRQQYPFSRETADVKCELLKDVLGMVNSWRNQTGYIVIGISESNSKPNGIVNVTEHIDDAILQQFINSKTSSLCNFSYRTCTYNECTIGIFEIPVQKRPVFIKKKYGKLLDETVYVRHGTCTEIARLEEVLSMSNINEAVKPILDLSFWDCSKSASFGSTITAKIASINSLDTIPDFRITVGVDSLCMVGVYVNKNYYRQLYECYKANNIHIPLRFAVSNTGNIEAVNVRLELALLSDDIEVLVDGEEIRHPKQTSYPLENTLYSAHKSVYCATKKIACIVVSTEIERIHAKQQHVIDGIVYIRAQSTQTITCIGTIYYNGCSVPAEKRLTIYINHSTEYKSWGELKAMLIKDAATAEQ